MRGSTSRKTKAKRHIHLSEEQINNQKKLEEEAKDEAAKQEGEVRKAELIDLLGPEDPLDKLNDLANKKRKHADDIHDYFKATKRIKSSVQYGDHLPGTVLNEPVLDSVMSNSDESGITHTEISSPFEGLSDIGSPGVVGPKHEGLPWMLDDPYVHVALQALPSPDYIPGPEEPQSPPLPDFVPEPSPNYVLEFDPEEDPEEDPADYPANGGGDGDDEDDPSDEDEEVDIEADDEEEEEEHPAPTDSTAVILPAANQAPSAEETKPFETDESAATPPPHPAYRVKAKISIPAPVPTPVWSDVEIPSAPLPLILSPVLVLSPSPPASPIRPLGYRAAMIRLRAEVVSTSHLLPLPPPIILSYTRPNAPSSRTPPLHLLSTNRREDRPEVTLPPRKRLGITLGLIYEIGESSSAAAARPAGGLKANFSFFATMDREIKRDLKRDVVYGITDSWDEIVNAMQGIPVVTDVAEFSQRMTECETKVRQDTNEVYMRLDDEQTGRHLLAGWLNMLFRDKRAHEAKVVRRGTEADKETLDSDDRVRETAGTRQRSCIARATGGGW
ncbi:hypothetical protein Tco_1174320 [Tanacetum coccineum]